MPLLRTRSIDLLYSWTVEANGGGLFTELITRHGSRSIVRIYLYSVNTKSVNKLEKLIWKVFLCYRTWKAFITQRRASYHTEREENKAFAIKRSLDFISHSVCIQQPPVNITRTAWILLKILLQFDWKAAPSGSVSRKYKFLFRWKGADIVIMIVIHIIYQLNYCTSWLPVWYSVSTSHCHPRGPGFDSRLYPTYFSGSRPIGSGTGPPSLVTIG